MEEDLKEGRKERREGRSVGVGWQRCSLIHWIIIII